MQRTDSLIHHHDIAATQYDAAVRDAVALAAPKRVDDTFRFPSRTPEAQRLRQVAARTARAPRTSDAIRDQHIDSAVQNAFKQAQKQQANSDEMRVYAQWVLHANAALEGMRQKAVRGER